MARKDLLKGLMEQTENQSLTAGSDSDKTPAAPARVDPAKPRYTKGAIGAVSQSIADLKNRSISELDPNSILSGGVTDRLDHDEEEHAELMRSIREYGQQVPVLVRPHPEKPDKYQIVYGRRRVMALQDLGLPVKAMVRELDDDQLLMAQGQENTARKDLTFIEKANFARQMRDAGYERKIICDALHIDKTVISRMLAVADKVPFEVIEAIGPAPSIGRDRWIALADAMVAGEWETPDAIGVINSLAGPKSDDRFEALMNTVALPARRAAGDDGAGGTLKAPKSPAPTLRGDGGQPLGQIKRGKDSVSIVFKPSKVEGFDDWLIENMEEIHRGWLGRRGE